MLDTIFGLPVHPLVVHATTVIVPLATLAVLLSGVWPRFRRWAGWLPLALSVLAVVLTPLSTQSGESLEKRVGHNPLVEEHSELADGLLPWVLGLLVAAALTTYLWRRSRSVVAATNGTDDTVDAGGSERLVRESDRTPVRHAPRWAPALVALVAVIAAAGTTVQVVRIGHSGAEAAWSDVAAQPAPQGGDAG